MTVEEANTLFRTQKWSSSEEVARLWQTVGRRNSAESAGERPSRIADSIFFGRISSSLNETHFAKGIMSRATLC